MPDLSAVLPDSVRVFEIDASAVSTVVLLAATAVFVAAFLPRRRWLASATGVAVAVIVGFTITPFGGWGALGFETGALHSIVTNLEPHRSALTGWYANADGPANVALYAPAGFLLAMLLRRPVLTAVALTAMAFTIECWQATLTTRVGSFDDVVANGLGAALGAAVAAVVLAARAVARRQGATGARPTGTPTTDPSAGPTTRPFSHAG